MKKIFMASFALGFLALTMAVFQMVSCSKAAADFDPKGNGLSGGNNEANQVLNAIYPIEGLWIGTYSVNGSPGSGNQYFSMIIKPDGTIIVDSQGANVQHLAVGTWSLNGTTLTSSFTCVYGLPGNIGIEETVTATWDSAGSITGTWSNVPPLTGSGNITLTRVN